MSGEVEIIDENIEQENDDTVEELANVECDGESEEPRAEHHSLEMDESDIAEMSMIAAQIESAEDFNLTFETIETSELQEDERVKELPKSRRRTLKNASPLYKSDQHEIASFLEEGIKEMNDSVVEKVDTSVAEALLGDWGSPRITPKRSALRPPRIIERPKSALSKPGTPFTSATRRPLKVLWHSASSIEKGSSSSPVEGNIQPARKRRSSSSIGEKHKMPRKRSSSTSDNIKVVSPKQVLKARNL